MHSCTRRHAGPKPTSIPGVRHIHAKARSLAGNVQANSNRTNSVLCRPQVIKLCGRAPSIGHGRQVPVGRSDELPASVSFIPKSTPVLALLLDAIDISHVNLRRRRPAPLQSVVRATGVKSRSGEATNSQPVCPLYQKAHPYCRYCQMQLIFLT